MTKLIVEILEKSVTYTDESHTDEIISWQVDKLKTIEISTKLTDEQKQKAREKLIELKSSLTSNEKIRVIEYYNDEFGDKNRKSCKVIFE